MGIKSLSFAKICALLQVVTLLLLLLLLLWFNVDFGFCLPVCCGEKCWYKVTSETFYKLRNIT